VVDNGLKMQGMGEAKRCTMKGYAMYGKKKAKAAADRLSARLDMPARKDKAKAELSASEKITKQSNSRRERLKNEPAV
jgi:hypothetical protein